MSNRNHVRLVLLTAVWWSLAAGPAAAQTWQDVIGAVTGEGEEQTEDVQPAESDDAPPTETTEPQPVDSVEAGFALKEALLIGAENAVARASRVDGFLANPEIRIPLPAKLEIARDTLVRFGLEQEVEDLELAMNRAAESSAAGALPKLTIAIRDLPIDDPLAILGSDGSAATDMLRAETGAELSEQLTPMVGSEVEQKGVVQAYDRLVQQGGSLVAQAGFDRGDLTPYVTDKTLDGLFTLIAEGESAIRADPEARTTPLLARAFASTQTASVGTPPKPDSAEGLPRGNETQRALKQALIIGVRKAVKLASQNDGFFGDPKIRIPMPNSVERVGQSLRSVGLGQLVDDFELSMNRAAEKAAAEATSILVGAVKSFSFDDALSVLNGGETAATETLRAKTDESLTAVFLPIITAKMEETGVTRSYEQLMERGGSFMALLGGDTQQDLPAYVTGKTLDGLFELIGEEEAKIREDPVARTTDLLSSVFGSLGN
jgi:Protein of unknown function (DUF4197)